jgi:hypothetical protein
MFFYSGITTKLDTIDNINPFYRQNQQKIDKEHKKSLSNTRKALIL